MQIPKLRLTTTTLKPLLETRITTNEFDQQVPAIYGDRIVWVDARNKQVDSLNNDIDENYDIYMYDIYTPEEIQITTDKSLQSYPALYNDRIVWVDNRSGDWNIYIKDLSTSTEMQITANKSNQYSPDIYGDRIVWYDERNGKGDIYMYDLSSSTETQITSNESNQQIPAIYGDRIVWQDRRNGRDDIYICITSREKTKLIVPEADFSTSVTSGYAPLTVQFTDLSHNSISRVWDFNSDGKTDSSDLNPVYV